MITLVAMTICDRIFFMKFALLVISVLCMGSSVFAEDLSQYGTTNPEELTLNRNLQKALDGNVDMMVCASGYMITKSGRHEQARAIFDACANAGWTGTMNWMSYMEDNGFGGDYDPDKSTEWDRRSAMSGDTVGKFNYGLDLIRGHGVGKDVALGRHWVDQAADEGLDIAQRLRNAGYDPDEVTPDADNWKYAPLF